MHRQAISFFKWQQASAVVAVIAAAATAAVDAYVAAAVTAAVAANVDATVTAAVAVTDVEPWVAYSLDFPRIGHHIIRQDDFLANHWHCSCK